MTLQPAELERERPGRLLAPRMAARLAGSYFLDMKMPGALPVVLSALALLTAAVVAWWLPAARAARIDVIQALRDE